MPLYPDIAVHPPQYGGLGFGSAVVVTDAAVPDKPVRAADPAERPYPGGGFNGLDALAGLGELGGLLGHGQYPGYGPFPLLLNDVTCWLMRHYPMVAKVGGRLIEPVLSTPNAVEVSWDGGQPEMAAEVKAAAEADLLPFVEMAKPGGMESLYFGRWLMEVVWAVDGPTGRLVPVDCPSVLPTEGEICVDKYRRFAGYRVAGQYRDARYGLLIVNDRHIDPVLGHTPLQAAMTSWFRATRSALNADAVERKAAGIQMLAYYAENLVPATPDGKPNPVKKIVGDIVKGMKAGQSASVPGWAFDKESIKSKPELATVPFIKLDRFDFGNLGPNLEAHLNRKRDLDVDICSAFGVPERAVMEAAAHGGYSDAIPAGDVVIDKSERLHRNFVGQANPQVAARWQRANFPKFRGSVRVTSPPMTDQRRNFREKVILTGLANKDFAAKLLPQLDERRLLEADSIPVKPITVVEQEKAAAARAAAAMTQGGGPPDGTAQVDRAAKASADASAGGEPMEPS